ncbi:hypothetical protein [Sutcliffiella horikoshii]|uniref:hypothetical protein n=1 Tax=Sutcliffiella horikoshii TaxID=79883 RepID=UPI001CFD849F|nr:hypothetical protein [Sutcliffiella horikoshii]
MVIRGENVQTQTNAISYQLDMFEQFHVQGLKVGDKVFYSDSTHICCISKIMSLTIIDKITITMQ